MKRPHTPIVPLRSDQRTGVVHDTERQTSGATRSHQPRPTPARSSSRSAAANSSAVSGPCSRSQARTARSPRLVASQRSAASARAADTVRPSSAACASSASKTSAGNEMDRFTTVDMELMVRPWYDHGNAESHTGISADRERCGRRPRVVSRWATRSRAACRLSSNRRRRRRSARMLRHWPGGDCSTSDPGGQWSIQRCTLPTALTARRQSSIQRALPRHPRCAGQRPRDSSRNPTTPGTSQRRGSFCDQPTPSRLATAQRRGAGPTPSSQLETRQHRSQHRRPRAPEGEHPQQRVGRIRIAIVRLPFRASLARAHSARYGAPSQGAASVRDDARRWSDTW